MARSSYIYIVRDPDGRLEAAFTVKYECVSYITRHLADIDRLYFTVTRISDGTHWDPATGTSAPKLTVMRVPEFLS